ncbi:MAG: MotA/TolQ/ExbB proton channel family protein [Planctomycetia bacterium]|nr:MotA/TolQ/ExbB proton channel family protein [Planctomycetia bacterium]
MFVTRRRPSFLIRETFSRAAKACVFIALLAALACAFSTRGAFAQDDFSFDEESEPAAAAPELPSAPAAATAAPAAPGESGDAADSGESKKSDNYLMWMFRSLGWFFSVVFALLSMTMVALIVINIVNLRRSQIVPEALVEDFGKLIDENRFQEAYEYAKDNESLLGQALSTGLARMPSGYEKASQAMQDVTQAESMRLEHQLGYLALIGNLAPMIGLFGTVVGMIASFQAIASGGAAPSPQKLAEGIATALFTTELGLAIALPALAAYDILKNRLARFILDVAVVSESFMGRFSPSK